MKHIESKNQYKYMTIIEHLKELRERILFSIIIVFLTLIICLIYTKEITLFLQQPALGVKFLQLAPGEYLFVSLKVAIYSAVIIASPLITYQVLQFILPGLTKQEQIYIIPIVISSIALFFSGTFFSYKFLVPITLNFLINYGSEIIEPIWSFDEYCNFLILITFSTAICFQIPVIQILLGINNIVTWKNMLNKWKYIAFTATIIGAIITPSTDPFTQVCLTCTIIALYFSGIIILKMIKT
uniref:Sec-independent protein translocase component TatC n=1 Tax=Herposiphonia versicolor TaxID=2007163 RepID=A0A1Z1MG93_9FLOR|nr:Sec-independent protein translocase component TatC [Herposiphonia versicolor]ARW64781.1 Sec-independent protein translocase component TatC [Herposiphonia versicolor]